jgi:hypothetical protein
MEGDLFNLGISASELGGPATHLFNVRFDPADVTFFDPRFPFPGTHKLYRINRYQPIDWDDDFPGEGNAVRRAVLTRTGSTRRSEEERRRAAIDGTRYSPIRNVPLVVLPRSPRQSFVERQATISRPECEVSVVDAIRSGRERRKLARKRKSSKILKNGRFPSRPTEHQADTVSLVAYQLVCYLRVSMSDRRAVTFPAVTRTARSISSLPPLRCASRLAIPDHPRREDN